jgi:hypothetical protein
MADLFLRRFRRRAWVGAEMQLQICHRRVKMARAAWFVSSPPRGRLSANLERATRFRQSILQKAFRGGL